MGAGTSSVVKLVSQEFIILVIIGGGLFTPLTYWALNRWLQEFAYKTSMDLTSYIIVIAVVLGNAFVTIGYKVILAATANPVNSLKNV